MHYGKDRPSILPHDPFKAIIAPRPIGWIGTLNGDGVPNLGPYSFFSALGNNPHLIGFTSEGQKHSYVNARDRGEFTFSLATEALTDAMNISSAAVPDGANEFEMAGLELGKSIEIATPFVAASPAALECVTVSATQLTDRHGTPMERYFVIGEVVQTHIRDEYIRDGRFDTAAARPIARMGYRDYATVTEAWELTRPDD
ncbi:flavin reductase family protein [Maritimibacter alkaliphilus]|uniref:flavin reductase family protein n=1 Tax=Maritimibacter alkaliphilus TaxID=404236 RepID=UPI001C98DFFE|nr:flavin reductase family protein [Maritimibacter alkaliphilus]MBY6090716.1 flavin reductase family protein [Maritimibacter alkaliphilus]